MSVGSSSLVRPAPEPRSTLGSWGASVISSVGKTVADIVVPELNIGSLNEMLSKQFYIQQVMQQVTMASNLLRSQHDAEMAPIRNMRAG
jgi:proteasome assembly chaperone (PAC2) family protein